MEVLRNGLYWFLSLLNFIIPKKNNLIVVYGRRMLNDNSESFLDYLLDKKINNRYRIVLLLCKDVKHGYNNLKNVSIHYSPIITVWYTLRARYIIHTHGLSICTRRVCKRQTVFNLWHGSPLKNIGRLIGSSVRENTDSFFLCTSPFFAEINKKCFAINDKQIFIGSNPRNDVLFHQRNIKDAMEWTEGSKIVVMMPTFRVSTDVKRKDSENVFPIINASNIDLLNDYLRKIDVLLVIKPHPYQNKISFLRHDYSHIKIVYNEDVHLKGLKLYELLGNSDALITDFSSVYFDYLLLNKPIGFTIDDMESYKQNRGYTIDDPLNMMPGMKIQTIMDLKSFLKTIADGRDDYENERITVNALCNTYTTPNACERIVKFLGINI